MTKQTKRNLINIAVLTVLVGITLLVLLLSYRELNFKNIGRFLRESKPWCVALAFVCLILTITSEGFSIYFIARRLGHKSKIRESMAYSTADIYYSAITPSASGGQPASLYYMLGDGMSGGIAGFTLVLNLISYTSAAIIMGIFAFIVRPGIFTMLGGTFPKILVILGFVCQSLLLGFAIVCMLWSSALRKIGNGIISLGTKMKIVKKPEKWRERWSGVVDKYRGCREILSKHFTLLIPTLLLNLLQRVARTFISCFVCYGVSSHASFVDLFCMQVYVLLGYNSLPLPGGVGAYEYMYLNTYGIFYGEAFILSAMMVSRVISYYCSLALSATYTLIYHGVKIKQKRKAGINEQGEEFKSVAEVLEKEMTDGTALNECDGVINGEKKDGPPKICKTDNTDI